MLTWTRPDRRWFEWPLLALKIGVLFAVPAVELYRNALEAPGLLFSSHVHELIKRYEAPVAVCCSIAALLLTVAGVLEWVRRRRKQAAWDFGFAVIALYDSWLLYVFLTTKMK